MSSVNVIYQRLSDEVGRLATVTAQRGTIDSDPNYGTGALFDGNPAELFKFTGNTGALQFQYAAKQVLQILGLIHHTCDAGFSVRICGDNTPDWTTPAFSTTLTIPAWFSPGTTRAWPVNPWADLSASSGLGYFYWLLDFVGTNSQPIQFGQLWLGAAIRRFDPNINWGIKRSVTVPLVENRTRLGVSTIYPNIAPRRTFEGEIWNSDAQASAIESHWHDVGGRSSGFLLVPVGTTNDCRFVRYKTSDQQMQDNFIDYSVMTLAFEEVSRGLRPGV